MTSESEQIYEAAYRLIKSMARVALLEDRASGDPLVASLLEGETQVRGRAEMAWKALVGERNLGARKTEVSALVNDAMVAALRDTRQGLPARHLTGLARFLEGFAVDALFEAAA